MKYFILSLVIALSSGENTFAQDQPAPGRQGNLRRQDCAQEAERIGNEVNLELLTHLRRQEQASERALARVWNQVRRRHQMSLLMDPRRLGDFLMAHQLVVQGMLCLPGYAPVIRYGVNRESPTVTPSCIEMSATGSGRPSTTPFLQMTRLILQEDTVTACTQLQSPVALTLRERQVELSRVHVCVTRSSGLVVLQRSHVRFNYNLPGRALRCGEPQDSTPEEINRYVTCIALASLTNLPQSDGHFVESLLPEECRPHGQPQSEPPLFPLSEPRGQYSTK